MKQYNNYLIKGNIEVCSVPTKQVIQVDTEVCRSPPAHGILDDDEGYVPPPVQSQQRVRYQIG